MACLLDGGGSVQKRTHILIKGIIMKERIETNVNVKIFSLVIKDE